jgi:hypothetical protein
MRLPVLDKLYEQLQHHNGSLAGWGCVYVQHVLESNISCAEFLVKLGLDRNALRIIGKAYSTSNFALQEYRNRGFFAVNVGEGYQYQEPFDNALIEQVRYELSILIENGIRSLLIIDEGAIASRAAIDFTTLFEKIAVVELTSRGAPYFPLLAPVASIVDVARSPAKKTVESPIIAASMVDRLTFLLSKTGLQTKDWNIGLIGVGAIGSRIMDILQQNGFRVYWCDREREGGASSILELMEWAEVLLSSTGEGVDWTNAISQNRNRARFFANCGSSDIEFKIWNLRRALLEESNFTLHVEVPSSPWSGNVTFSSGDRNMIFLCGGFPINFDGSADPIPPNKIQLTRALLMAGAIQAVNLSEVGVHALDPVWQSSIVGWFQELPESPSTFHDLVGDGV